MRAKPVDPRRIVPDTRGRDVVIAVIAGAAVLAFVGYAFVNMSRQASAAAMVDGVIISRKFVPQAETQITFGKGGLNSRQVAGEYSFQVRVPQESDREYKVLVDPTLYETRREGEHILFKRPAGPTP